jgi:hypothetical protein
MRRVMHLVLVIAFLLLAGGVVAQPEDSELSAPILVEQGSVSGGGYRLTSLSWQINGSVSGEGYLLVGQAVPLLRGNGCCCTYLPVTLDNSP